MIKENIEDFSDDDEEIKTDIESVSKVYDTLRLEGVECRIQNPEDNVYYVELDLDKNLTNEFILDLLKSLKNKYQVRFGVKKI